MNKILLFFILKYECDWDRVYSALEQRELVNKENIKNIEQKIKCNFVSIIDDEYPEYLKRVLKPSFVIFYCGDITVIRERIVAVDGELSENDRFFLESQEIRNAGRYLFDGETITDSTLNYLIENQKEFALVFKNINSLVAKKTISTLKNKSKNKWVVFSEKYLSPTCEAYKKQEYFRMVFPADETVIFSELSQNKGIDQKINFCRKENLKMFKFGLDTTGGSNSEEVRTISKPEDINFFVSYKN